MKILYIYKIQILEMFWQLIIVIDIDYHILSIKKFNKRLHFPQMINTCHYTGESVIFGSILISDRKYYILSSLSPSPNLNVGKFYKIFVRILIAGHMCIFILFQAFKIF